jgi:hypothetical protein
VWFWSNRNQLDRLLTDQAKILVRQSRILREQALALREIRSRFATLSEILHDLLSRRSESGQFPITLIGSALPDDPPRLQLQLPPSLDARRRELVITLTVVDIDEHGHRSATPGAYWVSPEPSVGSEGRADT